MLSLTFCAACQIPLSVAEGLPPAGQTTCDLAGWGSDDNPAGINVHAGPSADSPVLGTLPPVAPNPDGYDFIADFDIVASHNGWLQIRNARDYPYGQPERETYSGMGWIHGSKVTFRIQSGLGYQQPDPQSQKLLDLHGDWLTDVGRVNQVLACEGKWALLDYSLESSEDADETAEASHQIPQELSGHTAWFRRVCAIQETTCDGIYDEMKAD
ncbi:hypothetical protein BTA51_03790 [Hahella sp. CCB-MM4]|nr:hypothetical protein BTA51_03790 [Hahella sp. CCB-MM4]